MKPTQYFSLFDREARLFLLMGLLVSSIIAVGFGIHPTQSAGMVVALLMSLPGYTGIALNRAVRALETRPSCILLPGLRPKLWRYNTAGALVIATAWGQVVRAVLPDLPVAVTMALSAAIITGPMVPHPKPQKSVIIAAVLLGIGFGLTFVIHSRPTAGVLR